VLRNPATAYAQTEAAHKVNPLTTQPKRIDKRTTFIKIALKTFPIISILTATTFYILYTSFGHWTAKVLMALLSPGLIIYIVFTGDIHFGQKTAGVIVTALGAWIFWTLIFYFFYTRRKR
jgi:hypothetical protein